MAIERITREADDAVLTERLFAPLGMTDTAFAIPAGKASRQARPLPMNPFTGATQTMRNCAGEGRGRIA